LVYLANDILFHAQRQRADPADFAADSVACVLRSALAVMVSATAVHANAQPLYAVRCCPALRESLARVGRGSREREGSYAAVCETWSAL
jgi:hypothetical protein